ncbi:MAG: 16S rRNA (cytosine(967)-C(5))-methyltransferase RsmB [Clostridia bacterium]|nr:16S rRNA (cytosine(967)-C(5))-methyltransferase RsmB [Clostridia bacterium]MBR0407820.1 16S rRNA (cytosine(967)-C(5))-methyltransferase RsmB [Clostridia bacterium]
MEKDSAKKGKRSFAAKPNDKKPYGKPAGKPGDRKPYGKPGEKKPFGRPAGKPGQFGRKPENKAKPAADAPSSLSRKVALEIFQDVVRKDAYASLSLDDRLKNTNLPQLDKRFCASIVYTTLENLIRIDYALSFFLKDAESLEPTVRDILRISACQLLFHDRIPENAIVDEAVKLTRGAGLEGLTGLTNAVLRSMVRGKDEIKWPAKEEGAKYLSIMYSVPLWLAQRLTDAYGPETAEAICSFRTQAHYTVIRPNLNQYTDEAFEALLQKKVWEVEKGAVAHAYRVRKAAEIAQDADYLAGHFSIQGESSMLAAQAVNVKRGMQVLDCCAAPGGKTAYMAEQMTGTGRVYAWDVHEHRVTLIRAMAHRLHLENVRPVVRDASVLKDDLISSMDAVLLDAPCSGLGVMDNKPDIKYRATPESVKELTGIQEKLLDTCCQYVKRNGTLVYSTCSVLPEENGEQVKRFLQKHPEFVLSPLPDAIDEKFRKEYTDTGLQLLPHRDGVEGFFIARMRRIK